MSTNRAKAKKKRDVPRIDRVKIIEYVCIGLVILLFLGLAFFYGKDKTEPDETDASPSPVPTADPSIRGKNVLDAIDSSPFTLTYQQDRYDIVSEGGTAFVMHMLSDDGGITRLSFETVLCADPEEENEISESLIAENKRTLRATQDLLDLIMPVLKRTVSDSDVIVSQCKKVVKSGESYSKHIGRFTVRILSDPEAIPQTVLIEFIRDP